MMVELPPVQADLFGLVDRTDQQPNPNRQQLDFGQRNLDVPGNDETLVEDSVEDVDQTSSAVPLRQWRHRFAILGCLEPSPSICWRGTGLSQQWRCHRGLGQFGMQHRGAALNTDRETLANVAECYRH